MSITLSSVELEQVARAVQLLVSPLDHGSVDEWRSVVNRHLGALLRADSAGFLLPVSEGLAMYSEEHDPVQLAAFPDVLPPSLSDGTPVWETVLRSGVALLSGEGGYGAEYQRYLDSEYFNEYAGPNGACDTLSAAIPVYGRSLGGVASLHFWHARPWGNCFGEREMVLLRLLFPAFRAGVETQIRWGSVRGELMNALDTLAQSVLVCSAAGAVVHQTPALSSLLAADPEGNRLRAEMIAAAEALRLATQPRHEQHRSLPPAARAGEVHTAQARYLVRPSLCQIPGYEAGPLVLVALERQSPATLTASEVRDRYGLTPAQARVTLLIGRGRTNEEIAQELFISPHTARRHTERVFSKLGIRYRSEVGSRLVR